MKQRIVVALGGNAIQNKGEDGTYEEQLKNAGKAMRELVPLARDPDCELIITHGNGPQVGNILSQNSAASPAIPPMPMFVCDAMSQGQIGYLIQQTLTNSLKNEGVEREIVTVVSQVEVDQNDPAFRNPSKPIGQFHTKEGAKKAAAATGYVFKEDANRGYRRVVPSPEPVSIEELEAIRALTEQGVIVIAVGGGGIPIIKENNSLRGIDAVIDKDKASSLLADKLEADTLVILTAVDKVCLFYGQPNETELDSMTTEEAKKYLNEGHFAEGSMKPKIEATINFVNKNPQRKALIACSGNLQEALEKRGGTWIKY
ncbi:MAG: carbamate kinase [Candidatus Portnoybacteria bacterium]|nr:carbamate kinase [Candidatus Portnoybacteria bacterium]